MPDGEILGPIGHLVRLPEFSFLRHWGRTTPPTEAVRMTHNGFSAIAPNGLVDPAKRLRDPGLNDHARLEELLEQRRRFEGFLARLSSTFIHLPPEAVDNQIERGLQQIVEFLELDRSGIAQFSNDGKELINTHSYSAPGAPPFPPLDLAELLPWYTECIRKGEVMRFCRLPEDLPPEAAAERQYCERSGLQSQLTIPFKVGAVVSGAIGFGLFHRTSTWPQDLVQSLQLVAEIFANAQARKQADLALRQRETRLRQTMEALRVNEARLRMLLETTHAVPWVADAATWQFTYIGPPAVSLLGYPIQAWSEPDFWMVHLHPEDRDSAVASRREQSWSQLDYSLQYRMLAADGRAVWIHDVVSVEKEDGVPRTLRGFLIDVTARHKAEEDVRNLREQLARAGRIMLMGELSASIAHEVNQPLCAIVSNAQAARNLLERKDTPLSEVFDALHDILHDGQRASTVIARVRTLLQKKSEDRVSVDLADLIRGVHALVQGELSRRGISIRMELDKEVPPVHGDRVQIQQVVLNLLTNAADAMEGMEKSRRAIHITLDPQAAEVMVSVADVGCGFDATVGDRIFEPFFSTRPDGMGMGLAICKTIIAAHGGRIEASPNPLGGAIVRFTLPIEVKSSRPSGAESGNP